MQLLKASVTKIAFCAVALLVLSTMYAKTASASRYAVAFIDGVTVCTGNAGDECDET